MLLVTLSQHGSFSTDASQAVKPMGVSPDPHDGSSWQVSREVEHVTVENSESIAAENVSQCCKSEALHRAESDQVIDASQHKFRRYVRLARLANIADNERLSAHFIAQAHSLLFGYDELE